MSDYWTDERADQVREMWAAGCSAATIAQQLGGGLTRSAVLGKVHRNGWLNPSAQQSRAARPQRRGASSTPSPAPPPGIRDVGSGKHARDRYAQNTDPSQGSSARAPQGEFHSSDREKPSRVPAEGRAPQTPIDPPTAAERATCFLAPTDGAGVSFIDIRDGLCRWPLGDSRDIDEFRFCGSACELTNSYCDRHTSIALSETASQKWWARKQDQALKTEARHVRAASAPVRGPRTFENWGRLA